MIYFKLSTYADSGHIDAMTKICSRCHAAKWKIETKGVCCVLEKVRVLASN